MARLHGLNRCVELNDAIVQIFHAEYDGDKCSNVVADVVAAKQRNKIGGMVKVNGESVRILDKSVTKRQIDRVKDQGGN